jgi:putative Holliday junction resolvase
MNFLAIDYGTKNIGLARASSNMDLVLPFGRIENSNHQVVIRKLIEIITSEKIDKIIIGLPAGLDGSENRNTIKVRNFGQVLGKETTVPIEFMTEVFSSQAGDRMGAGVSRDEKAAMVILEGYLQKLQQ